MPRLHQSEAFYHVTARGNRKEQVFLDPDDYHYYLKLLDRYKRRYDLTVHAFALMPNHIHLLVQVQDIPLSKPMQGIQQCYTQRWNKKYGQVGHVFQGRYKASMIEDDPYLLATLRYIHMNPVEAGLVDRPEDYEWSSHRCYLGKGCRSIVECSFVQGLLGEYRGRDINGLVVLPEHYPVSKPTVKTKPREVTRHPELDLEDILDVVGKSFGLVTWRIAGEAKDRLSVHARKTFVHAAVCIGGYRATDIAAFLGKRGSKVSAILRELAERGAPIGDEEWATLCSQLQNQANRQNR